MPAGPAALVGASCGIVSAPPVTAAKAQGSRSCNQTLGIAMSIYAIECSMRSMRGQHLSDWCTHHILSSRILLEPPSNRRLCLRGLPHLYVLAAILASEGDEMEAKHAVLSGPQL